MLSEAPWQTLFNFSLHFHSIVPNAGCPVDIDQNFKVYSANGPTLCYYLSVMRISWVDKKEFVGFFPPLKLYLKFSISDNLNWLSPCMGEEYTLAGSYCVSAIVLGLTKYISIFWLYYDIIRGSRGWEIRSQGTSIGGERGSFCTEGIAGHEIAEGSRARNPNSVKVCFLTLCVIIYARVSVWKRGQVPMEARRRHSIYLVKGPCELPSVVLGSQTRVLWNPNGHCQPPHHLSSSLLGFWF